MPKSYARLAGTRATGRSFDDRVGAASLVIALRHLNRALLRHAVTFIWSTREEIGLEGARAAAASLGTTPVRVHAVDTFVSADSPLETPTFAVAPIGKGAVARALDNSSVTPAAMVDTLARVARTRGIALQIGTTNGGNDGSMFVPYGVVDVPLAWPLRYSHSPAEVIDLKDLVSLADWCAPWRRSGESAALRLRQARLGAVRAGTRRAGLGDRLDRRHRGGAARAQASPVTPIEQVTGFPEMMDGRVKTLHPKVHGGLLARRDHPGDQAALLAHDITPIDLVAVNLYPFQQTAARADVSDAEVDRADRHRRPLDAPLGRQEPRRR